MGKINFRIRFMNKSWVVAFVAAAFILIGTIGKLFGFELDLTNIQENVINVVYALFGVLAMFGIVQDPTTEGLLDSERAQSYTAPGVDEDEFDDDVDDVEEDNEIAKADEIEEI